MKRSVHRASLLVAALAVGAAAWRGFGQSGSTSTSPDSVLPADTAIYLRLAGYRAIAEDVRKTAAHQSLVKSGLAEMVGPIVERAIAHAIKTAQVPPQAQPTLQTIRKTIEHALENGVVAGINPRFLSAELVVVLPNAGPLAKEIDTRIREFAELAGIKIQDADIEGRKLASIEQTVAFGPSPRWAWWIEGPHFVFRFGLSDANDGPKRSAGKSPNLVQSEKYKQLQPIPGYRYAGFAWVDIEGLFSLIPQVPQVTQFLELSGLKGLKGAKLQWGPDGASVRSDYHVITSGPRTGFLRLVDGPPIQLAKLPRIPADVDTMVAASFDGAHLYDTFVATIGKIIEKVDPDEAPKFRDNLGEAESFLGLKLRDDLLAPFGPVAVLYQSPTDGPLGFAGITVLVGVKDRSRAAKTIATLAELIGKQDKRILIEAKKYEGADMWIGGYREPGFPLAPTLALTDHWLIFAPFSPASATRFLRLQQGHGPAWKAPDALTALIGEAKGGLTQIMYADPKPLARTIASLLPFGAAALRNSFPELAIDLSRLPDLEQLVSGLFPGTSIAYVANDGLHGSSRSSLPLVGPAFSGQSGAATGVLLALALPAVQQAREAARRSQDMNNQKQIALAMHVYHDVNKTFPRGTAKEAAELKVDERLSWIASLLPYLEQDRAYQKLALNEKWNSDKNRQVTDLKIDVFLNPAIPVKGPANVSHFVGIAGVGKDAAMYKSDDKRAGVFGYDRETPITGIRDGTSNTIMILGVKERIGKWGQGGPGTIRGLTAQPYVNGPDGFGTNPAGVNAAFCDGSVRFLSKNIDPKVLEALVTKNGGEAVPAND